MHTLRKFRWFLTFILILMCSGNGWAKEVEKSWTKEVKLEALGVRGGINFKNAGLPPGEREDFEQFDIFAVVGLPWKWKSTSEWEVQSRLMASVGALRGARETGFITTLTGGPAVKIPAWRLIVDAGVGGALLSDWEFGSQNIGGPFQFIAHAGVGFQLPWRMVVGWRFHHMSDATIYGSTRGVDFHMLELSYVF